MTRDEVLSVCVAIRDCEVIDTWEMEFAPSSGTLRESNDIWADKAYQAMWRAALLYSLIALRKVDDFAANRRTRPDDIKLSDLGLDLQTVTGETTIIDSALRDRINKGIAHITKDLDPDNRELAYLRRQLQLREKALRDLGDAIFAKIP